MFRWLLDNKEWLFSGGGVVLVALIIRFVFQHIKKAKLKDESMNKWSLQQIIEGPPAKPPVINKEEKSCSLSPLDIMATIEETPLLQKPDVAKNYIGLRISWAGKLARAEKTSNNNIRIAITTGEGSRIEVVVFEINPKLYPGLGLLKYKHPIRVSGVISRITDGFELEDAHLEYELAPPDK